MLFNLGCTPGIYKPELEERLLNILSNSVRMDIEAHRMCCRSEQHFGEGTEIINVCPGCDQRFGGNFENACTVSIWEVLDGIEGFNFPNYNGAVMTIHDSCPVRERPGVHAAVRSLIGKMGIKIIEAEYNSSRSICCGDDFYPNLPIKQVHEKIKKRAESMPCQNVIVYCVTCLKAVSFGGKTPRYLLDLLFGEDTVPGDYNTAKWRDEIQRQAEARINPACR